MYLDHHNDEWEYEPKQLTLQCGYVPDFLVIRRNEHAGRFQALLIEYKPRRPTETYIESTMPKLSILCHHVGIQCFPFIFHGSFWDQPGIGRVCGELPYEHISSWWANSHDEWPLRQQISQHRFDLVSELSEWKRLLPEKKIEQTHGILSEGDHVILIEDSFMGQSPNDDGMSLLLKLRVIEGSHQGVLIMPRLRLKSKSWNTRREANEQLSDICRAVGVLEPKDSSELHDKPFIANITNEAVVAGQYEEKIYYRSLRNG
jgi:hypothetical protein